MVFVKNKPLIFCSETLFSLVGRLQAKQLISSEGRAAAPKTKSSLFSHLTPASNWIFHDRTVRLDEDQATKDRVPRKLSHTSFLIPAIYVVLLIFFEFVSWEGIWIINVHLLFLQIMIDILTAKGHLFEILITKMLRLWKWSYVWEKSSVARNLNKFLKDPLWY